MYAPTDSPKYISCASFGHMKQFCPKNIEQAENPTTAVPPVEENVGDEISIVANCWSVGIVAKPQPTL